jgi:hypothetical protein
MYIYEVNKIFLPFFKTIELKLGVQLDSEQIIKPNTTYNNNNSDDIIILHKKQQTVSNKLVKNITLQHEKLYVHIESTIGKTKKCTVGYTPRSNTDVKHEGDQEFRDFELKSLIIDDKNVYEHPMNIKKSKHNPLLIEEEGCEDTNNKQFIIYKFMTNVKGKEILIEKNKHCGSEGYWLERQMGLNHNSNNEPDILGYEMKKNSSKITIGDFSASEYLFSKKKALNCSLQFI